MSREKLVAQLNEYSPFNAEEGKMLTKMIAFVSHHESCFLRSNLKGQVTGSAWILDYDHQHVLLIHHSKLDKWLQPGGHTDGNANVFEVALKEAKEETGLNSLIPFGEEIFDIDIHDIPEYKEVPAHLHYDIRFIFEADMNEKPTINHESKDWKWIPLQEVEKLNNEESVLRMVTKTYEIG